MQVKKFDEERKMYTLKSKLQLDDKKDDSIEVEASEDEITNQINVQVRLIISDG